jgi:hypothetical protein
MKRFIEFITLQTFIIGAVAVVATWLCLRFDFKANIPMSIVGIAVIFPIVFAINAAFRRREQALGWLADLKGATMSLFFGYRDWVPPSDFGREELMAAGQTLSLTMTKVTNHLARPPARDEDRRQILDDIYDGFSRVSRLNERIRQAGVPANEISRANQYLTHIIRDFEKLTTIRDYRTPMALRGYWQVFLNLFPIFFAPLFAYLAVQFHSLIVGYGTAVLFTLVLVGLDNIQEKLENPFDQDSIDDIQLDFGDAYRRCMEGLAAVAAS